MPKQYLPDFRKQIISSIQNGLPMLEARQRYQIASSTLYRWVKEYGQTDTDVSIVNYTTLQQKNQQLDHILQIIRLSSVIEEITL